MKNIHILPTDKPSRLYYNGTSYKDPNSTMAMDWFISSAGYKPQNIYITSEEEIKEGDYYITILDNEIFKADSSTIRIMNDANKSSNTTYKNTHFKIILTDNQDLIKDGVQAIDDEFLEWFVKNTSCEEVVIEDYGNLYNFRYLILIPKEEEVKEETLEEAVQKVANSNDFINGALFGCLWQQERMYSEEEVDFFIKEILHYIKNYNYNVNNLEMIKLSDDIEFEIEKLFEQLKNK